MAFPIQAILCAVDFSPFCALVCNYGVTLARRAGVRLYLFTRSIIPRTGFIQHWFLNGGGTWHNSWRTPGSKCIT